MNKTWVNAFGFFLLMYTAVTWAAPVPDTGQTKCYDVAGNVITCPSPGQALYGQDANYSINPMSYTKLDANGNALPDSVASWVMVKDNVTGLIWEVKTNKNGTPDYNNPNDADNIYTWYDPNDSYPGVPGDGSDMKDFIDALNNAHFGGHTDWRLPSIKELDSIVNSDIPYPRPTINTAYFPNTVASFYWSSTTYAGSTGVAWGVYFNYGYDDLEYKSGGGYVRAVRGGQSGSLGNLVIGSFGALSSGILEEASTAASYTDNGDGTVTDTSTGLMWQQASDSNKTWEQALSYCENSVLAGYTDWRLPTRKELKSLVDYSRYNPAIDTNYFPNTVASFYWSSTTYADGPGDAWGVPFRVGYDGYSYKTDSYYVRAVRGGHSGSFAHLVISPSSRNVAKDAGSTTFSVTNTGTGTMPWKADVTSGGSWLSIDENSGRDTGTITCAFDANTSTLLRTGTIRVIASGASGSPGEVTVTQLPPQVDACTATINENYLLHIPYITYTNPSSGTLSLWADFVYEPNVTSILFKLTSAGFLENPSFSCVASTLSSDLNKIHIPDFLIRDKIFHSMDLEFSPTLSSEGNAKFRVTNVGTVPD